MLKVRLLLLACVSGLILGETSAKAGALIVNEIMNNPSAVLDANGEWFEIYNTTGSGIDIDGWTIRDDDTDSHVINNGGSLIVPADGYLVLGINADMSANGGVTVDYQYADFFLANGADEVVLVDLTTTIVDSVAYDGGPIFPDPTGASMELGTLFRDMVLNDNGMNWAEGTMSFGAGDLGTPGAENTFVPEPSALTVLLLSFAGLLRLRS